MTEQLSAVTVGRLIDEAVTVAAAHAATADAEARYPEEAMAALRRLGLLSLLVPVELGGLGGTLPVFVETVRRLAGACGSTALCYTMHVGALHTLVEQSRDQGNAERVRAFCAGGKRCSIAVSPARGPDGARTPLQMWRVDGGYRLDGRKAWCTGAVAADALLVYVTDDGGGAGPGPAMVWIDTHGQPGLHVHPTWNGIGMRGSCSDTVAFENVVVPAAALLGEEQGGTTLIMATDAPTLLGLAAASLGCGEAAMRIAAATLARRLEPALVPPPVALELAAADLSLRAAAAALHQATDEAVPDAAAARPAIMAAKALCNVNAATAADRAMAASGASAYQHGQPLERHWRDAHAGRTMLPTPDDCRVALARTLLGWS